MNRREFLAASAAAVLPTASAKSSNTARAESYNSLTARICMFTDHVKPSFGFDLSDVARMFKELGLAGPDLTIRPGGLVSPERVEQDLPTAWKVFQEHGLTIPMITTEIASVSDPVARPVLVTAAKLGIRYYRPANHRYKAEYKGQSDWQADREATIKDLIALANLSKQLGIQAGFHSHSGPNVGGTVWDAMGLLAKVDPKGMGLYYDLGHATVGGDLDGWKFSLRQAASRINMIAIKDYIWEKIKGGWKRRWVPLGEGMVRIPDFFKIVAQLPFAGPISVHIEYDPGGNSKTEKYDRALAAGAHDLNYLREQIKAAFS